MRPSGAASQLDPSHRSSWGALVISEPLAPSAVAELLGAAATIIRAELFALPAAVRTWHPAGGEWCAQEVVGHLIEAEKRGFAGRIRIILSNDSPNFEGWDQDAVARARNDCGRDWAGLWDEFSALRADSVPLVAGLVPPTCCAAGTTPRWAS